MRRYSAARNAIEANRERWGLGDASQSVPAGEGPPIGVHPLPTTSRGAPAPYSRPLPAMDPRALWVPNLHADSGSVDYAARQRSQLDDVPKGSTAEPVTVYPAWESRLEGMRDFLAPLIYPPVYVPVITTPATFELSVYTVPQGYVAFWKKFRFWFEPVPAQITPGNCFISLLVDGLLQPDYFNLPLGSMSGYEDTFVIAAENRQLSLRIQITAAIGDIDTTVTRPLALLYGNVRPRTGSPESRDVGVRPPPPVVIAAPSPPPQSQPRPTPPAPPVSDVPPFEVRWVVPRVARAAGSARGPVKRVPPVPTYANGKPLSAADQAKYRAYLDRTRPSGVSS